jgi:hypothetical protein
LDPLIGDEEVVWLTFNARDRIFNFTVLKPGAELFGLAEHPTELKKTDLTWPDTSIFVEA